MMGWYHCGILQKKREKIITTDGTYLEALEDKGTKRESYLVSPVPHESTLTVVQI